MAAKPDPPEETGPADDWPYRKLGEAVRDALQVLPSLFKSDLVISGVRATDLHAFNTSLGATIEEQVVAGLNAIRDATWDKDGHYANLRFVRQSQTFPDVVLKPAAPPHVPVEPVMGIELKGWYVMAKEGVPSFRYTTTPKTAALQDLLVVFPWALSGVISGAPILFAPYVTSARHAAEYRNWWWQYERKAKRDATIKVSAHEGHYPMKSDLIADVPAEDAGNFGRIARTKLLQRAGYIDATLQAELSGIPLYAWRSFFKLFRESNTEEKIKAALERMTAKAAKKGRDKEAAALTEARDLIAALAGLLDESR
ncbi:MAG TPA: hypothetical protein VG147_16960 [Solirubrobacteraceae bacterium]|jgi:hypothetical protein|nr:hypothetical protein [Solirubrobacteraceae bacterium]